ncbi:hypothetical protein WMF39_45025 [Sorangium sp. So ce1504]|uniref:hypothetical protein n=1 Tax=Sorangium sp. So ce1504 TaxID=3133337 RepID=UPI003F5EA7FA
MNEMRRTAFDSVLVESARIFRSHLGHRKASKPKVRFMSTAHSTWRGVANNSPSSSRPPVQDRNQAIVLRFHAISFWRAELLLHRAREDEDAFLELDRPVAEASPRLELRRRARVTDIVPFLRAPRAGQ